MNNNKYVMPLQSALRITVSAGALEDFLEESGEPQKFMQRWPFHLI
jgi:hypothetical protein